MNDPELYSAGASMLVETRSVMRMRFGITPLHLENILGVLAEGGKVDLSRFSYEYFIRSERKAGFSLMELSMDAAFMLPEALTDRTVSALQGLKEELGVSFTAHLPLWALEPSSPNAHMREASVDCLVDAVNLVRPLKPEAYVMHATGALGAEFSRLPVPPFIGNLIADQFGRFASESVRELLRRTKLPSRELALENGEFPFEATWRIAELLDTSICLDTGHLLSGMSGPIDILDFLKLYYARIREIHLHDGKRTATREGATGYFDHRPLGAGALPIKAFFTELQRRKYRGPIIFELKHSQAMESLEVIRKHLPDLPID